jgi:AhpD family alkylhydroperoxidase
MQENKTMKDRISQELLSEYCPRLAKHLTGLGKTSTSAIPVGLQHLIKLRVSQINSCCYCQHMHTQEARDDGEDQRRLDVLAAWREAPCFSRTERAALAWAEALTHIVAEPVDDQVYLDAVQLFGERDLVELTTVILEINSWNRVAVGFRLSPEMAI